MNTQKFTPKFYPILAVLLLILLGLNGCAIVEPATFATSSTELAPETTSVMDEGGHDAGEFGSDPDPKPGTMTYTNVNYGFEFDYPEAWSLKEKNHGVILKKGTNRLGINFRWEDERVGSYFSRTGVGAGDFISAGKVNFMGQTIPVEELILEGKSKGVFFGGTGLIETDDLVLMITLEDLDSDYLEVDLSAEVMAEAKSIVESFRRIDREADSEPGPATMGTGLTARLEIPAQLTVGEEVNLKFVLKNASDTPLYVLTWYTPLEGIAGEIFRVTRDGQTVPYRGILASRGSPTADDYVLLYPGESASSVVDLADGYDFSQAGEYRIKFVSPRISHIARTEAEMARTMEELGPVNIHSNEVTVQLVGSPPAEGQPRLQTTEKAQEMIEAYLRDQELDLGVEPILPVEELPIDELWGSLGVQVFRVSEGDFFKESFLIRGSNVIQLGAALGGQGLTSLEIADLDHDGQAELYYAYSSGSGNPQSRIGVYAPAYDEFAVFEADISYPGHWRVASEAGSHVRVQIVEGDDDTKTLRYLDTVGDLVIAREGDGAELTIQLDPHLPDEIRRKLSHDPIG